MNKLILGIVGAIVIIGGFAGFKITQIDSQIMNQNQTLSQSSSQMTTQLSSQSLVQVANSSLNSGTISSKVNSNDFDENTVSTHNKLEDCWVTFDKKVYDITKYAVQHPGGIRSVARYCGKSLDVISDSHNGGSFASVSMQNILKKYLIGTLK